MIAAYVDGVLTTSFPTTQYYTATSSCTNASASATVSWNGSKWVLNVSGVDSGNTKCTIYFTYSMFGADTSGANEPILADNMIPVYYDNATDSWIKTGTSQGNWYNYKSLIWANAVTVTSGTRATYINAAVGTSISMNDILGMWVWIPRYEYKYTNLGSSYAGGTQSLPGGISINFINGTSITTDSGYIIHPTFRNGSVVYNIISGSTTIVSGSSIYQWGGWDKELTGFWMGKFETGLSYNNKTDQAKTSNILILPNKYSISEMSTSNDFITSQNVQSDHGIGSTLESHMSKNDEWGAVAYLSQSTYGKYGNSSYTSANKEVYINNAGHDNAVDGNEGKNITGRSAGIYSGGTNSAMSTYGTYEYNNCPAVDYEKTECTESVRNTNANKGTGASTTGNIYGVYDMSGGALDKQMAVYNSTINLSGFSSLPNLKYYNNYSSISFSNACSGSQCYGQALYETSTGSSDGNYGWYNDYLYFSSSDIPWIHRGGGINPSPSSGSGIFTMGREQGYSQYAHGFRVILK
jgi:hypothetical protein